MTDILTREQVADLCTGESADSMSFTDSRALMLHDTALRAALAIVTQERDMLAAFQFPKETELLRLQREVEALKQERVQHARDMYLLESALVTAHGEIERLKSEMGYHEAKDVIEQLTQQLATAQARVKELESGHEAARSLNKPSRGERS